MRASNGTIHVCRECRLYERGPAELGLRLGNGSMVQRTACKAAGVSAVDPVCLSFFPLHTNGAKEDVQVSHNG